MGNPNDYDLGGISVIAKSFKTANTPGQAGTEISSTEIGFLDGVVAGTAAASKALVLGSSSEIATITTATITNLTSTTVTPTTIAGSVNFSGAPTFASTSTFTGSPTFNGNPIIGVGKTIDLDSTTHTGSSHAATATKYAFQYTTETLTTAAAASQNEVITFTSNFAATDLAFVTAAGGTNTQGTPLLKAVMTSNTLTITIKNHHASEALNGTLIFNVWVLKA